MKTRFLTIFILTVVLIVNTNAQHWDAFENLLNKTWIAEGQWGDGSSFKQEVTFALDLEGHIIVSKSKGYINKEQTEFGDRNHGIRKFDVEIGNYQFWEFDVFGGVTSGVMGFEGKDIVYLYEYGNSVVTDKWEYVDDSTYKFIVGSYENGIWKEKYLETTFKEKLNQLELEDISKMLMGSWTAAAWNGTLDEEWVMEDGLLKQTSQYKEQGKVVYKAVSYIEERGGELILISIIKDSNPKIFKATSITHDEVVFENSEYKNPSKVIYSFKNSEYKRTISGKENGEDSVYTFEFETKK